MANESEIKQFNELIFTWRIENIHLCWQKTGEKLVSPTFSVDWLNKSSWNLFIYPRGIQRDDNYISYFIAQENKTSPIDNIEEKFELYLLAADGSNVLPEISKYFLILNENGMIGCPKFISWKTLMNEKSHYLPDGTLTLCCRIRCERDLDLKEKPIKLKAFARTRIRKEEIDEQMVISFDKSCQQRIGVLRSILRYSPIAEFIATVSETSAHEKLTIDIDAKSNEKIKFAVCHFLLVDSNQKVIWKDEYPSHDTIKGKNIVLSFRFPKNAKQYVPEDAFTERNLYFSCKCVFTNGTVTQKIEKNDYGNNIDILFSEHLSDFTIAKDKSTCQTAADALKLMFDDPIFHNAIIKGKNADYKVHEMVMCPRSDVFKKLFQNKVTNIIKLSKEEDDTLQRVIYFLYTDTILDMHWNIAMKMYEAGCKYKIELLKEKCRAFIKRNLSTTNVCDVLILIQNKRDPNLKKYVRNFIIENHFDVFSSVEWNIFSKTKPTLALKYMMIIFKQK